MGTVFYIAAVVTLATALLIKNIRDAGCTFFHSYFLCS
jgi:hypothetical protein